MSGTPLRVLLGVTGGIAACKAPFIVRHLRAQGVEVRCALTAHAARFVSPLTLEVLSGHEVWNESYLEPGVGGEELHVVAGEWADAILVAPATANTLGALAHGLAPDFLCTTVLMHDGPVFVAPAMHPTMWNQPAVRENVGALQARGVRLIGPDEGALASGEVGVGRMTEPEDIALAVVAALQGGATSLLRGRHVVVAAGPTYEAIDPVRFLGNRSSGKMGFALARAARDLGAHVVLVAGPTALATPLGVERVDVRSALEMQAAVDDAATRCDLVIMAAAVADFRPKDVAASKIKKDPASEGVPQIELVRNPDILHGLATSAPGAIRVGFAAETESLLEHAQSKLDRKGAHALVANDVSRSDIGFSSDENEVFLLRRGQEPLRIAKSSKDHVARQLMLELARLVAEGTPAREGARR